MEYRNIVYNAARDGKLGRLQVILEKRSKDEVAMLVHAKTNGATPLIMAGRNGHLDVVKYLIETCDSQIEQEGSVTIDGETIEGAPPLWCAAAAGHLAIVKYLVEHGANVNKTTFTNSTPLRAACFDGHFAIVKYLIDQNADIEIANRHGHTCLMISCYKKHIQIVEYLLTLKAQVNRKSVKGNTALHDCAESGSLDIVKLLLKNGAIMVKDHYSMTPLMAAAVAGYYEIVEYLIEGPVGQVEKIEALELLGAFYIDKKRDNLAALHVWQRAMNMRYDNGRHSYPKPMNIKPVEAYENAVEARSCSTLDELVSDPDEMRMQALLVRERILGPAHPDTSYYIRYRGALYADMGNFDRCISLWMYALEMQQNALEPVSPMTQSSFLSFAELFSFMTTEWRGGDVLSCLKFQNLMAVLQRAVEEVQRAIASTKSGNSPAAVESEAKSISNLNRLMVIVLHLLCLMTRLEVVLSHDDKLNFRRVVYRLVRMCPLGLKRCTLLHLACSRHTTDVGRYPICKFPSLDVVNLLIEVGADVNAQESEGCTPLHAAAKDVPCDRQVMKTLIENGAHIDACNNRGEIAAQLLHMVPIHDIVPPLKFMSLQCLASRQIGKHGLPYKGIVGSELERTIELHQSKMDTFKAKMDENSWPREPLK